MVDWLQPPLFTFRYVIYKEKNEIFTKFFVIFLVAKLELEIEHMHEFEI